MSAPAPTPGPWVVRSPKPARYPAYRIETKGGHPIANVPIRANNPASANADLLAAAPELLDQCERAATILHNIIEAGQIGRGYATNLADLQAVIAKARGEA